MTEMVTSGSMSGVKKRSDGPLGESASERSPLALGAAGPGRHRASPRLYRAASRWRFHGSKPLIVNDLLIGQAAGTVPGDIATISHYAAMIYSRQEWWLAKRSAQQAEVHLRSFGATVDRLREIKARSLEAAGVEHEMSANAN